MFKSVPPTCACYIQQHTIISGVSKHTKEDVYTGIYHSLCSFRICCRPSSRRTAKKSFLERMRRKISFITEVFCFESPKKGKNVRNVGVFRKHDRYIKWLLGRNGMLQIFQENSAHRRNMHRHHSSFTPFFGGDNKKTRKKYDTTFCILWQQC